MSGTHGALLGEGGGVGGLRSLEEEVAPMDNPVPWWNRKEYQGEELRMHV